MTLHQLRIFRAVAHHRNLSRAAEEVHLSQPAVSMQMTALQEALGVALVETIGRRLHLTEAGELLSQYASRLLGLAEEAEVALGDLRAGTGRVRFGASSTPGVYVLPEILAAFERANPNVRLHFEVSNSGDIERRVAVNALDFGVTGGAVTFPGVTAEPWGTDELAVVVGPGHAWAGRRRIAPTLLARARLVAREVGSGTRQFYEAELRRRELIVPPPVELGGIEAVKRAVEAGLGVAILSRHAIARELAEGRLEALELQGVRLVRPLVLVYQTQKRFSSAALALLAAIRARAPSRHRRRSVTGRTRHATVGHTGGGGR